MKPDHTITCVYCGQEYPEHTPTHGADVAVLTEHIAQCEKHPMRAVIIERDKLRAECELQMMQMAAVMTASMQNTQSTVKDRITRENPYYSQGYEDVCRAIDREIEHREAAERLRTALHDIFELASRQASNRGCAVDEGLIATAKAAVRVIRVSLDEHKKRAG